MSDQGQQHTQSIEPRPVLFRLMLTGFMGAGKSTVGALLARALSWEFLDLDAVVEASSKLTVAQIFRDQGEAAFRAWEQKALEQLSRRKQIVLALGGGTVEDPTSRTLLTDTPGTCLVFLDGNLADLLARCTAESKIRPLLAAPDLLATRHAYRLPLYRQANLTVLTTGLEPQQVTHEVLQRVFAKWQIEGRKNLVNHGQP